MTDEPIKTPYDDGPALRFLTTREEMQVAYLRGVADADELGQLAMQLGYTEEMLLKYAQFYLAHAAKLGGLQRHMNEMIDRIRKEIGDEDGY